MSKITYEDNLKNHFDNAKDTLSNWEIDIAKAEDQLALLTEGDRHESVYQAFRDVVFFACSCMDDTKAAANTFGKEWEAAKPRANTNPYRHPIDFVISRSGVQREEIKGSDTLCRWAKVTESIHPLIKKGTITYENFVDAICKRHGGIRGCYDRLTGRKAKGKPKGNGKALTSADFDKKYKEAFDDLKAQQSGGRHLVAIVLDIKDSRTYPDLNRVKSISNGLKEFISCFEIDDTILDLMEDGGGDNV